MDKYDILVNILDVLRREAPENYRFYHPLASDLESVNKARSRALIHLFLKVKFGLLTFEDREKYVTDGVDDGGIDGYFIDKESKAIYFIQSKFRNNRENFERREIKFEELINMDIERITEGHDNYENGTVYNDKVKGLIEEIQGIADIGRYSYVVVLLANTKNVSQCKLRRLSDGNPVEEYNFEKVYNELVFPIVTGTFFNRSELIIEIHLSGKSADEITYGVETEYTNCKITVLFVPVCEIAKALYRYKNTILKYNPRCYLDMRSGSVNAEIARTIEKKSTNEFALFNNGITMISDDTNLNKKIAREGLGQLIIMNPQIINGGQTAYTLSSIYEDALEGKKSMDVFNNKEVLLKVITLNQEDIRDSNEKKLMLIEEISKATNQQTAVSDADRRSNDRVQIELQALIYKDYGLFYQRKAGEFGEGLKNGYISKKQIIDRELLLRLSLACSGKPSQARRSGGKMLFSKVIFEKALNVQDYHKYVFAYRIYNELSVIQGQFVSEKNNIDGVVNYGSALRYGKFAVVSAIMKFYDELCGKDLRNVIECVLGQWLGFEEYIVGRKENFDYFRESEDMETGKTTRILNFDNYYKGKTINTQIAVFPFHFDCGETSAL